MRKKHCEKRQPETKIIQSKNYNGVDRRKEDDPAYFGYYALEGLERRQADSFFRQD